jgi:hypothetical protein
MQQTARAFQLLDPAHPEATTITTTLRDLIGAIQEEVEPEEDHLVADVVLDLVESGRIRFLNPKGDLALLWLAS